MTHSAQHDPVTNLPNRLLLSDRITQAIALARRQNRPIAVIFLDLDRFKYINDSLGHAIGDKLLQSVSRRLLAGVRASAIHWSRLARHIFRPDDPYCSCDYQRRHDSDEQVSGSHVEHLLDG